MAVTFYIWQDYSYTLIRLYIKPNYNDLIIGGLKSPGFLIEKVDKYGDSKEE